MLLSFFRMLVTLSAAGYASCTDIRTGRIPNRIVYFLCAAALLSLPFDLVLNGWKTGGLLFLKRLCGSALLALVLALVSAVSNGGLGMGDVKLLFGIGMVSGPESAFLGLVCALVFAAAGAVLLLISGRGKIRDRFPFAPCIFAGMLAVFVFGRS